MKKKKKRKKKEKLVPIVKIYQRNQSSLSSPQDTCVTI